MKKAIYTLVFMFCALFATAQAPQKFNYQAVARNAQGAVLPNQNVKIRVSILDGSASGTSQYSETHSATSSQLGLFNLAIGGGTVVGGNFANITWAIGDKYLKIEMDATGGNNFTLVGTSQLLSVPYALYAASGNPGPKGDKGDTGATGLKGDKGDTGATGLKGDKGDTGATGLKGDKGDTGATGQKGDKGDAGPQGPSGGAETLLRQCVVTGFTGTLNAFITVNTINSMCSAANGNVFYTGLVKTNSGGSIIMRFEKDASGIYHATHSFVDLSLSIGDMVVINNYLYFISKDPTLTVKRISALDLTGVQQMTFNPSTPNFFQFLATDGTNLLVSQAPTSYKTFQIISTALIDLNQIIVFSSPNTASVGKVLFDGVSYFHFHIEGSVGYLSKYNVNKNFLSEQILTGINTGSVFQFGFFNQNNFVYCDLIMDLLSGSVSNNTNVEMPIVITNTFPKP